MNFDFSDEQKFLRDQARKFLTERGSLKAARKVLEGKTLYDKELWKGVVEMGWTGTTIPEAYGGLGLGYLELCMIAEELGRGLAPVPFSSSVYLATEALLMTGSEAQKKAYLPKLAAGEIIGTFAASETAGAVTASKVAARFANGKLDGVKTPVPDGEAADFAVVLAKTGDAGERALSLCLVDLKGAGVKRERVETIDGSRPMATIAFSGAAAEALGSAGDGLALMRRLYDRAAIPFAFEQVAGAEAALETARDYALNRYAFGRQIGSFQAIKHKLADVYSNNVIARSNAYFGAWALSTDAPELPLAAAAARISAIKAYDFAAQENAQTHGGVGFTWEYDCHLYLRRARQLAVLVGSPRLWKDRLVSELEKRNAA